MKPTESESKARPGSAAEAIGELGQADAGHLNTSLSKLTNLTRQELTLLRNVWSNLDSERRRLIARRLLTLSERSPKLNFDDIFKMLLHDIDPEVRTCAVFGLKECEDPQIISTLLNMLAEASPADLQLAAITALGSTAYFIETGKIDRSYAGKLANTLVEVARSVQYTTQVRLQALQAVAPLNLAPVHELIREFYQADSSLFKVSAIRAMGQSAHPTWATLLLDELSSNDPLRRAAAATACGEAAEASAVPHLIRLLQDRKSQVRLAAIRALGKIGGVEAKKELLKLIHSPNQTIRKAAREALDETEASTEIVPRLNI